MRRTLSFCAALITAATLSLGTTGAAAPDVTSAHCAVQISPIGPTPAAEPPVCFDTQAEVDAYLTAVTAPPFARAAAGSTILGVVYQDVNYGGGSLTMWGAGTCAAATYGFATLDPGWTNSISSAKGSSSCWLTLYSAASYGGDRINCTPSCASLSTMNDRSRSVVFRPVGTFG